MARLIAEELPDDLYRRLSGQDLQGYAEKVLLICSVDDEGWPHPAMLSYFEVVARDRRNVRLATYSDSRTTANMRRTGKLTISLIDERVAYYIKGSVQELSRQMRCTPYNSKLNLQVEQVLADQVDETLEPGAYIASGVVYKDPNRATAQARAKDVLRELLE